MDPLSVLDSWWKKYLGAHDMKRPLEYPRQEKAQTRRLLPHFEWDFIHAHLFS